MYELSNLEKLRKAQLIIAREIKRICNKYEITYFLDAGSMLGAIRHKGYIPWDDDMDIGMPAAEYRRFLDIAPKELGAQFFLDNYETNEENALVFSKIRLIGTTYLENKGNPKALHNEIFVDIFPYYYISDNRLQRKIEGTVMAVLSQAILSKSGYKVWKGEKPGKRLKFIPSDLAGCLLSKKIMHNWIDKLYTKHFDTKNLCIHAGSCYNYWYFPKEVFSEFIDVTFEDETFKVPKQYDYFLRKAYGDYMKLPPEEKRITHQILKLDMGTVDLE